MKPLNILIREIREDRDLTQKEVAKALGIAQQYYSKYETGEYELPVRHLIGLAKLYNLNTDYILGLTQYQCNWDKLNEPFLDNITVSKLMSDILSLSPNGRKSLIEFIEFLKFKERIK